MRKIFHIISLVFCLNNMNSQNSSDDYILLDKVLQLFIKNDKVYLYEESSVFVNQEKFFSKAFLNDYTYPTIGVDSRKVKKLIKKMDFNYLSKQKKVVDNWNLSKSKYNIIKYIDNPANHFDKIRRYKISKPIYSKDFKMAFIYYEDICGYIDCGSTNVIVLKKCNDNWELYLNIPISIS